jgi:putative flavoprotein involved in K+ transport
MIAAPRAPNVVRTTTKEETMAHEELDTAIIGGGQAGLAVAYHLKQQGRSPVILDMNERVGDSWRTRWDSLRLFTPAKHDGLPGWRFPAPRWSYPTKDEMADYMEAYAARFELDVRTGIKVERLSKEGGRFLITAESGSFHADNVVVATGAERTPWIPDFAADLNPRIVQLHSCQYVSPAQLRQGPVLVVGLGNSGAEIAYELIRTRPTVVAGKEHGEVPVPHGSRRWRMGFRVLRFLGHRVLTKGTPIGRRFGAMIAEHGPPLIRTRTKDLTDAGVERGARVAGVQNGLPVLEDGRVVDVPNVVWCTGFREEFSWIDLPIFDSDGKPRHESGVVPAEPGLYFVGLIFQYAVSSDALPGVGRDAKRIAKHLAQARAAERDARAVTSPSRGTPSPRTASSR